MIKKFTYALRVFICIIMTIQLTGCGTIMYPERKGQKSGKIDAGVAVLDGVGLLLFLIPGIIAFAIDFSNGTIYLPGTSRASLDTGDMKQISFNAKNSSTSKIEKLLKEQTGLDITLDQPGIQISKLESIHDLDGAYDRFASVSR
jgi:hypothetical protein